MQRIRQLNDDTEWFLREFFNPPQGRYVVTPDGLGIRIQNMPKMDNHFVQFSGDFTSGGRIFHKPSYLSNNQWNFITQNYGNNLNLLERFEKDPGLLRGLTIDKIDLRLKLMNGSEADLKSIA